MTNEGWTVYKKVRGSGLRTQFQFDIDKEKARAEAWEGEKSPANR